MKLNDLDEMTAAYLECAIWADLSDENRNPYKHAYGIDEINPSDRDTARDECFAFLRANLDDLQDMAAEQVGHDFWLTRNGHGSGFWDRGLGDAGERLTKSAHAAKERSIYLGDDGRLYITFG